VCLVDIFAIQGWNIAGMVGDRTQNLRSWFPVRSLYHLAMAIPSIWRKNSWKGIVFRSMTLGPIFCITKSFFFFFVKDSCATALLTMTISHTGQDGLKCFDWPLEFESVRFLKRLHYLYSHIMMMQTAEGSKKLNSNLINIRNRILCKFYKVTFCKQ